jgi:hypothetical protein
MPPTESKVPAAPQSRVRFLLIVLGVVAVFGMAYRLWPAAAPGTAPSNQARDARKEQETATARGPLDVRLDDLKQQPPSEKGETTRNPFRFYVKPPPPPPPRPVVPQPPGPGQRGYEPPPPPPPPPITIKFFGVLEVGTTKVAVFTDGKGQPVYASEGQTVLGQYKLLKIGVESVTMSYLDGKGIQQIPLRGGGGH